MPRHRLAEHFARLVFRRQTTRESRGGRIRSHGARRGLATAAAPDRGDRALESLFSLDGEHRRMVRRIDIQADHVAAFGSKSGRPTACSARTDAAASRRAATLSRQVVMNLQHAVRVCAYSSAYCHRAAAAASSPARALPSSASAPSAAAHGSAAANPRAVGQEAAPPPIM